MGTVCTKKKNTNVAIQEFGIYDTCDNHIHNKINKSTLPLKDNFTRQKQIYLKFGVDIDDLSQDLDTSALHVTNKSFRITKESKNAKLKNMKLANVNSGNSMSRFDSIVNEGQVNKMQQIILFSYMSNLNYQH
ncbi:hypothetical protein A3Q56_07090 [Intoshia linei]|uniref:Uncharacterized protein n=1 Tax=Intoshia linei TaxID=1819745 RepID=A0A177AUJ9_9BILA|nr:hypothetical protein A3Q56_07090 [Intoshia linei]